MLNNLFQKYLTTKNIIFFIIAILFLRFVSSIQDIVIMFFASFVISCSLEPIVNKLTSKFSRPAAAGITLFGVILIVCAFFIPIIIIGGSEIHNFASSFPEYLDSLKIFIDKLPVLSKFDIAQLDIGGIISSASSVTSNVINETINIGKNIGSAFVYLIASLIIIYYFMADKETIHKTYLRLFPTEMREKADEITNTISQKVGGYVVAQITTMASVGIIMTVGLMILRVDYAILLGLITAIFDIIPVVGPGLALIICLIAAIKSGPLVLAMIVVVFAISQLAENNFVRPYVFGKFLDLHPLIIYLFLFITAKYLGIIGVVFAPAIAATAVVLIEELYMKNID